MNKPKFNIREYPGNYAMYCKNCENSEVFCRYVSDLGIKWVTGEVPSCDTGWDECESGLCYIIKEKKLYIEELSNCIKNGFSILKFDDFDWSGFITPSQTAKSDTGKSRLSLVSPYLIEAVGTVRTYGTEKYGSPDNWSEVDPERYRDALMRHWCEYLKDPMSRDAESGLLHIDHVACNVNFLVEVAHAED
ncbi:dATP/dGTP diphosphohydrolase domain-containing protein [Eubacterium sp.]|uniref:dATP/dGTP diphosphohydrolase domain-containing protein n=1 Tax=Eubacterium sp. TaxID=142586 RepID=UPI002FC779BB